MTAMEELDDDTVRLPRIGDTHALATVTETVRVPEVAATGGKHGRKAGGHRRTEPQPQVLPAPPSDAETRLYADRGRRMLTRVSAVSFTVLLLSQIRFVLTEPRLLALTPFFAFTVVYYAISLWVNAGTKRFDFDAHDRLTAGWAPAEYPSLDVFLPICRESLDVLHNTWTGVFELMEAYEGLCTVYVLDDGADPAAREMAGNFGFQYLVRPETGDNPRGWFKKAGNLRWGFAHSTGEYIAVFDADFAPRADLPAHLIPYLEADPRLGIIQSPQFFRTHKDQTRIERGASAVQELFYRLVQVSRQQRDGAICVGSCAIYRREALVKNGGATLIGHSEDVHTGFDLRREGWGIRYVPIPLATGLCPDDPNAFVVQQYRWSMGSMDLLRHPRFWAFKMPLRTRACYLSGFCYYLHTAVFTIITPLIPLILLLALPGHVRAINYIFIAPSLIYNYVVFPTWHRCRYGIDAYLAKFLYGWAHLFAIWDLARRRPMGWKPTGAKVGDRQNKRVWAAIWVWSGGTTALWIGAAAWRTVTEGPRFLPILGLGLFTGWIVALALRSRTKEEA